MRPEDRVAPRYVVWPEKSFALLYCNKAGSRSAIALAQNTGGQRPSVDPPTYDSFTDAMAGIDTRVLFLRDPMARIISAYSYAMMLQRRWIHDNVLCSLGKDMRQFLGQRTDISFEEFVLAAFQEFPEDKHIARQWGTHYGMADIVWPLEDSARGWEQFGFSAQLPLENKSEKSPVDMTAAASAAINDFYREDFTWYHDVCRKAELCAA